MTGQLITNSFVEIQESFEKVIAWLESFGVRISSTRVDRYKDAIQKVQEIHASGDESAAENYLPKAINTLHEIHDLIEVRRGFANANYSEFLSPIIEKLASGPDAYADENSSASNRARNTAFELIVASRLASSGLPIFRRGAHDLATEIKSKIVLIECKRPFAAKQIERRIKEGFSQLEKGYKGTDLIRLRGIVAVDVTRAHNPSFRPFTFEDPKDLGRVAESYLTSITKKFDDVMSKRGSKKTIGLIFRVSMMALPVGIADRVSYCQQLEIYSYKQSSTPDREIMWQIYEKLTAKT